MGFLNYFGGKANTFKYIKPYFYPRNAKNLIFCEIFGGGGWLMMKHQPHVAVLNDLDHLVFNFWKCLVERTKEMYDLMNVTTNHDLILEYLKPYLETPMDEKGDLYKALFFWLNVHNSRTANEYHETNRETKLYAQLPLHVEDFEYFHHNHVTVKCMDFEECIDWCEHYQKSMQKYYYLDPPYLNAGELYHCYFTEEDHLRLKKRLENLYSLWILSYDKNEKVAEWYKDYYIKEIYHHNANMHQDNAEYLISNQPFKVRNHSNALDSFL